MCRREVKVHVELHIGAGAARAGICMALYAHGTAWRCMAAQALYDRHLHGALLPAAGLPGHSRGALPQRGGPFLICIVDLVLQLGAWNMAVPRAHLWLRWQHAMGFQLRVVCVVPQCGRCSAAHVQGARRTRDWMMLRCTATFIKETSCILEAPCTPHVLPPRVSETQAGGMEF